MTANLARNFIRSCISSYTPQNQQVRALGAYKAAIIKDLNMPLAIEDKKQQKLGKTDVRLKVQYCSVNSIDAASFRCATREFPFVPGYEMSGRVLEVGKSVTKDQVIIGEQVAALSLEKNGGFAEECVVDVKDCFRLPSNVSAKKAAVLILGHGKAIYGFSKLRTPKEKEIVLVTAGPAGLGLAAIDVASRMYRAQVIAVTDSEDRSEFMRARGAFSTIRFDDDIVKNVLEVTGKKGAPIIFDGVGDYMFEKINKCVSLHGHILHAAPNRCKMIRKPRPNTYLSMVYLHALRVQDPELYRTMINDTLELCNEGIISAHIGATYPFDKINDAIDHIEEKQSTGKVVIEMTD